MSGPIAADVAVASGIVSASSVFYFLLVPALALWLAYWKLSRRHMLELAAKIPGPEGMPIIGSLTTFLGSSHGEFASDRQHSGHFRRSGRHRVRQTTLWPNHCAQLSGGSASQLSRARLDDSKLCALTHVCARICARSV